MNSKKSHPVTKNEDYDMIIDDLGVNGEGIGKINGYTVFVEGALPQDHVSVKIVKAKSQFGYGKLLEIKKPSPQRVKPICPIANKCGGCQLQHLSYEGQLAYKQNYVENCFKRIAKFEEVPMVPIIGMEEPYYYRNKVQFPVRINEGEKTSSIGFYASRSHRIIETPICYIQDRKNEAIIEHIRRFMKENQIEAYDEVMHKGTIRHIMTRKAQSTGQFHVTLVINTKKLPREKEWVQLFADMPEVVGISVNVNTERTNVVLGKQTYSILGDAYLIDTIGTVSFQISPQSFYQVNPVQTKVLYEKALEFAELTGEETVWDIYCGIGTISLFLAQKAKKVYGVEIVQEAIEDARRNAKLNNMDNVQFFVGSAEEVLPEQYKKNQIYADVIVVDPPRKGCEPEVLETMLAMAPKRIVYVSCDPATLARDVKVLVEGGYELVKVQAVDNFPNSTHIENVVLLTRTISSEKN